MDDPKLSDAGGVPAPRVGGGLLEHYLGIASSSRAMVEAARAKDWQRVSRLERQCLRQVHRLKLAAKVQSLAPNEQRMRVQLLRKILADDAEIRRLAEPWLVELEHLLLPGAGPASGAE